jgi:hypothetical protein
LTLFEGLGDSRAIPDSMIARNPLQANRKNKNAAILSRRFHEIREENVTSS